MTTDQFKNLIEGAETGYFSQIDAVVDSISKRKDVKVVLVAGPSCAGKTTSSAKLVEGFNKKGYRATRVSLDDFYSPLAHKKKKVDLESVYSLDLEVLQECLFRLTKGAVAKIPQFDFKTQSRSGYIPIQLQPGDICVIEGLHALNPIIFADHIKGESIADIYLQCISPTSFLGNDYRLLRRLVRDYFHRASSAERTFYLWDDVRRGERIYIEPFIPEADYIIKTHLAYEENVLAPLALDILDKVTRDSKYFSFAKGLASKLEEIEKQSFSLVPSTSLLQEFIPQ